MKMYVGVIAVVWACAACFAQDRVSLKNGNALDAQVLSVGETNVSLKTSFGEMRMARREIDMIVFGGKMLKIGLASGESIMAIISEDAPDAVTVNTGNGQRKISRQDITSMTPVTSVRFDAVGREVSGEPVTARVHVPSLLCVAVSKSGGPVTDTHPGDLTVKVDGAEMKPLSVQTAVPEEIVVLLDASGSMSDWRKQLGQALDSFASEVAPAKMRLIVFNDDISMREDSEKPSTDLDKINFKGGSLLHDALSAAVRDAGGSPTARRALILITDGTDTGSNTVSSFAIEELKAADMPCYVIGLAGLSGKKPQSEDVDDLNEGELERIASVSGGQFFIKDPRKKDKNPELTTVFGRIAGLLRATRDVVLDWTRIGPGWHEVEVESARKGIKIRAKKQIFHSSEVGTGS